MKIPFSSIFITFLFGLFFAGAASAQYISKGGGINQDEALDIATDAAGNSYVVGYFSASCSFAGGNNLNASGLSDAFVLKASPTGQILWVIKAGGGGDDRATSVSVSPAGDVFVTGHFQGTADFGGSSVTSAGTKDMFVAKYNTSGTLQWVNAGGGTGEDFGLGVAVDGSGNVSVTGEFKNTASFGSSTFTAGGTDVFVCKYNGSGSFLWAQQGAGPDNARGIDITADAAGNVYVTGQFTNDITFDNTESNNIYNAVFLVKFNASGAEQWLRKIAGGAVNIAYGICTDAAGAVYLTGDFTGNLVFFPNTTSPLSHTYAHRIFLAKYSAAGNLAWAKAGSSANEVSARSVTVADNGTIFIGGFFTCKMSTYADVYGQGVFNSVGFRDGFISQYDAGGTWVLARQFGGVAHDYVNGIAADGANLPVVAASFTDNLYVPSEPNMQSPQGFGPIYYGNGGICNDPDYGTFHKFTSQGAADLAFGILAHPNGEPLDYYQRTACVRDPLPVYLGYTNAFLDTLVFCGPGPLEANPRTLYGFSPNYTYDWMPNISIGSSAQATSDGVYTVKITTEDECFSSTDSVYVVIHPFPGAQGILDDHGINPPSMALNTYVTPITVCAPDTVLLTGIPVGVDTFYWNGPATAVLNDSIIQVTTTGSYEFNVINSWGCSAFVGIVVTFVPSLPDLHPYLVFPADADANDTISICEGTGIGFSMRDSLLGPIPCNNSTLITQVQVPQLGVNGPYNPSCSGGFISDGAFSPTQTGWHTVIWNGLYANLCDTVPFTVMDSVYVIVNPYPTLTVTWTGNTSLCPGDTGVLVASNPNAEWNGSGILSGAGTHIIEVSAPASVMLHADTVSAEGCATSFDAWVSVQSFVPPVLTSNPANALICPNDSVQLMVTGGPLYQWFGPQGLLPGGTSSIYVTLPGFYYCAVTDAGGCRMFSNTLEVKQYTTPFLLVTPTPVLCTTGDSALLSIITNIGSTIQWDAPLGGNSPEQTVYAAGTYSASVTSCTIITAVDITITLSGVDADITTTAGLIFCAGDSVTLEAAGNQVTYFVWAPGNYSGTAHTVYEAGQYTVTAVDAYGCQKQSDPITVQLTPNNTLPPVVTDTSFCPPISLQLTAQGQGLIVWYADSLGTLPLDTGAIFQTPILSDSITYYVLNRYGDCTSQMARIHLSVANCEQLDMANIFTPNGDGVNDEIFFDIKGVTCFRVEVYNRWGVKVFETDTPTTSWKGNVLGTDRPVSDGTYFYVIDYCPQNGGRKTEKGFFVIIH